MRLETPRFIIRDWTLSESDVAAAFRMYGNPMVTRYLGKGDVEPDLDAQYRKLELILKNYEPLIERGLGFWAVEDKSTGEPLASAILKPIPFSDYVGLGPEERDIEVGWHIAQNHWGQGIATEIGTACLRHGFESVGLDAIIAVAYPENTASTHVMDKLGMQSLGMSDRYYNADIALYSINRAMWENLAYNENLTS